MSNPITRLSPTRRQFGALALASVATTVAGATAASAAPSDLRSVSAAQREADTQALLKLINDYRAAHGRGPLRHSATLAAIQEPEASRQFTQGYISHGTAFLNDGRASGYSFAREVIALSYNNDLGQLMYFWKNSPAHRAAILAPEANAAGIGLAYGHGRGLPWRVLGNVSIYRYENGRGPADLRGAVSRGEVAPTPAPAFALRGGIGAAYHSYGGHARFGHPIMNETLTSNGGYYQRFEKNGDITRFIWSADTGAHFIREASGIGSYWLNNGAESVLGFPVMEERGGLLNGGTHLVFRRADGLRNRVIWSPFTGTSHVYENGAIGNHWRVTGAERNLGYPTTTEYWDRHEVKQHFSSGATIAWSSIDGSVAVR
ncbi:MULTISPECIES: CAP domain-containing protein [unclassified Rothia (in: high G+C Gram-positive bacteria)]|uniref:CAP domain-containing protein n=1 Tax=unclassified Rothia (in: high G+C Gram-positive bacteria) TaxID=2689056 RepID=UPI0019580BB9|nr:MULTISPECIES: CAP domain-containing protein [unclassified Rothia (in: high G+C Gram-positive bacteria)]MBM7051621.1 hypothetical protein [Rothia sp. ZJ1223]QRZ61746.1 hypothetical protein JR346_00960 [Rothia sp. ZJ932]